MKTWPSRLPFQFYSKILVYDNRIFSGDISQLIDVEDTNMYIIKREYISCIELILLDEKKNQESNERKMYDSR